MPLGQALICICSRCDHKWVPKRITSVTLPKVCPKCKNPNWNKPKRDCQESSRMMNRASITRKPTDHNGEYTSPRRLTDGNDY